MPILIQALSKPQPKEKGAAKKAIILLFHNRAFVAITMVSMLLLAGQMFTQSFYTYLFDDYFHANWMNLATQACTYSPMIIFMFFLPKLTGKKGKKEVTAIGMTVAALAIALLTIAILTVAALSVNSGAVSTIHRVKPVGAVVISAGRG